MIQQLIEIDQAIFLAINQGLSNPFFDWLLPILRNPYTWAPLYLFLVIFFIKTYGKMGVLIVVFTLANFGISDAVSSHLIKKTVKRVRPCNDIEFKEEVNIRVRCGSGFSFTSSHATNHFAMAFFWIVLFRRKWKHTLWLAITWATLISVSQIYVGVHYPFDVLCGALLGICIGLLTGNLFKKLRPDFFNSISPITE
ncbi:PAP2 family protein [Sphingobacterium spiritivorum ATCC 33300]|uniref:Undecaprenyl pyrophosphate phosphatase n=2 Tax=Sphingobacterium spiritivorum TaxID=258 RepID=A0A380BP60_SPHSI|nr:phosphatase PAP2 family protein [Sphingobacterium spiritivorum]EEI89820.1 PAP2 family protein [Sphingobacterium spiritivorum ATCC 33300]QQS94666.1 phosphatase PAP2 family protein [Sphingobacterium spiritivorum]SUJ03593.1 undecaprenyl pyrophosphate phosphatase [Sphingobacterium spiritivorum]